MAKIVHLQVFHILNRNQQRHIKTNTVELQWLEHRWLIYHGYFELALESLGKNHKAADMIIFGIIYGDFLFILIMVCCMYYLESR